MGWKSKYNIEFKGLKEGLHEFDFEVNDLFFEHFEDTLVEKGDVKVLVLFEKRKTFLKMHFKVSGNVELVCDRCLEPYLQDICHESDIFVKFGDEAGDDSSENVIWVLPEEHQVNVAQLIYEFIVLSVPLRQVHPINKTGTRDCNPEMIAKLKELAISSKTKENSDDPRWDKLKNLNNN